VPPYQQREYCATYTFPNNSHIIELNSHTHQWGKRFRIYGPPQQACSGQGGGGTTSAGCLPGSATDLIYESFDYSDPLVLRWGDQYAAPYDTPLLFSGTQAARTIKFCALYDNGFTDPGEIKRQSTSVVPQVGGAGGPCSDSQVKCLGGSNAGASCFGNDAVCPGGLCDACNVMGGSTTTDEMLIPFARYFVAP
ncbi:MAG: hypothetical protein VCA74_08050, partial [Deltaproteobacteria bacterium]